MLNKKIIFRAFAALGLGSAVLASANGYATPASIVPTHYVYVGVGMGATNFLDSITTVTNNERHKLGALGFIGGGLLGYQYNFDNPFNLGIEAFINGSTSETDAYHYNSSSQLAVKSRYDYGIRALPGYRFTPDTNGYVIIGYARGNFSISDNGVYGIIGEQNFNSNGIQIGLGASVTLIKNLLLRTDLTYTGYGDNTLIGTPSAVSANVGQTYQNAQISTLSGMLSLVYNFN